MSTKANLTLIQVCSLHVKTLNLWVRGNLTLLGVRWVNALFGPELTWHISAIYGPPPQPSQSDPECRTSNKPEHLWVLPPPPNINQNKITGSHEIDNWFLTKIQRQLRKQRLIFSTILHLGIHKSKIKQPQPFPPNTHTSRLGWRIGGEWRQLKEQVWFLSLTTTAFLLD